MENTTEIATTAVEVAMNWGPVWAVLGAFLAAILGGIGSTLGVGMTGQAAAGLTAEKPESFGMALVLEALPGSQGIYGLIGVFLIGNFFLGNQDILPLIDTAAGLQIFFASLPLAITALFSGIFQGRVAAAGVNALARNASVGGKAIVLAAIVETFAILGLLSTFLLLDNVRKALEVLV